MTAKEFFKKVPDFSLYFDELANHFRRDMERNEENMKILRMHTDFAEQSKKLVS